MGFFSGCDNIYHGAILPCLMRPQLPPFSYSTERGYNTEYRKKRSSLKEFITQMGHPDIKK
jgi:hypothetical protein